MGKSRKVNLNEVFLRVQRCKALSVCVVDAVEKVEASDDKNKSECFQDLMELVMFEKDIENAFTAKVAQYLADGYVFNLTTMNGSQGENGKVNLRKGDEVIRILLDKRYEEDFAICYLFVGRNTNRLHGSRLDIIWNNDLEEIERTDFYVVGRRRCGEYYGTKEQAEAAQKKRIERYGRKLTHEETELSDAYKATAYKILKKRDGFRSIKKADVIRVRQSLGCNRSHSTAFLKRIVADIVKNGRESSELLYSARG